MCRSSWWRDIDDKQVGGDYVLVLTAAASAAFSDARGKVASKGPTFAVTDAVASKIDDGIEARFMPTSFDWKAAAKDQKVYSFDLRAVGPRIALRIDADAWFSCID